MKICSVRPLVVLLVCVAAMLALSASAEPHKAAVDVGTLSVGLQAVDVGPAS
uniref:Stage-specific S antigen-like protein n=1 Tax=Leishmania tropica TaxID=5666 RepID=D3XQC5_LEITR|nr:stage-specific S antigen-like protein [Leishmania tropica]